ncbi:hypothetical protein [Actinoplanes sp. NPDC048796]|uniref:hypothetical protein n=1 Tax=Actinoplanes sp. NPDC048796 TaxID=3155640 RepID=UPI0033CE37F4
MAATAYVSIASVIVALMSFTYNVRDKRRDRDRLIEAEMSRTALLPDGIELPLLTISWDDQKLINPELWTFTFTNAGQVALKSGDIEQPPTITFFDGEVMAAIAGIRRPTNRERLIRQDEDVTIESLEVRAPKTLINPHNQLVVFVLTNGTKRAPEIDLGANDFSVVMKSGKTTSPTRAQVILVVGLMFTAVAVVTGTLALISAL